MSRRALLIGLVLGSATAVAGQYSLSILVGLAPPRGVDLHIVGPDGGVTWEKRGATARSHLMLRVTSDPWLRAPGRYRLVATPPAPLRGCEKSFVVEEDSALALFGVNVEDGGCRITGEPSHSLLGRSVGDYPPYTTPWVQPASK